ncbi:MAG: hypothetical protein HY928_05385 [Elusimicrobia bacterium]|nr:hypothetical protein [Elusimicrobiota bacterium]
MPKSPVMDPETAFEAAKKAMDIALEAQEKAEETYKQAMEDLYDAAQSTLRQSRSAAVTMQGAMPWAVAVKPLQDQIMDLQEKSLENARTATKTAFDNYRRNVAEPMRKLSRESASKLSPKARA